MKRHHTESLVKNCSALFDNAGLDLPTSSNAAVIGDLSRRLNGLGVHDSRAGIQGNDCSEIRAIDTLSPDTLQAAYQQAREWLADSQSVDVLSRLNAAAGKLAASVRSELSRDKAVDVLLTKPLDLDQRLLQCEHETIKQVLAQSDGSVVRAARLLGRTYQGLAHMIETKHPDLIENRTPVRRRPRKIAHRKRR